MKISVDIPDKQVDELAMICKTQNLPRAELIRRAIADFILKNQSAPVSALGFWRDYAEDGVVLTPFC